MLFTGATIASQRVRIVDGSVVERWVAGFGYDASDLLCTSQAGTVASFIKGIGMTVDSEVCTTVTAAGSDVFIEGVRVSTTGRLVIINSAPAHTINGNPCAANGRLAVEIV